MKKMIQFSVLLITVFVMSIITCNMPSDPFKKPSNSKAKLFLEENEQTIDFGAEVKIGVSVFLAEHIEALHIFTRNNGLDSIHHYSSNAVDDTLYFNHKFTVEGKDTIFVTGELKNKNYMNKTDTLPIFILPAPDSIRFDSIPQSLSTVKENHDTLQFIASLRSEKPLSFSVKSQPALDTNQLKIAQFKDTVRVVLTTDSTGEYAVTLYAQRDTLIDSAVVNVTVYEPLEFESAVLSDVIPFGKSDTLVFTIPTEREDTITCKLLNEDDFGENELSFIKENSDSLVIVFTPDSGGEHEFLLLLDNGKISDTLKYTVTVDDHPSVGLFIESNEDSVPFGNPVNIGVSVFLPQLIEELHISISDNSLDSVLESSLIYDTVYVEHAFLTESKITIYVTVTPVNSNKKQQTDSLTIFVLPEPEKIPVWNVKQKAVSAVEGEEVSVDLRDFINEDFSGDFSLDSDFGEIEDTVWKWKPLWGSDTTKTAEISAVCDSDVYKLKLIISVAVGDTTGPAIRLLHSSMDDTIIGSSQIYVEAVVKDSGAGVSSVQISYGSNSANMALTEDSIYMGSVKDLKNGEKTEIKIVAEDGSMRKNTTEHIFYVTYDSTIGDNEAPVISQESGPENNRRITDGQVQLSFSVTDDSDIDSVYWTLDGTFKGILAKDDSIYSLTGTLDEYGSNEIEIFAVDKSVTRNRGSQKLVFDYNTEITAIEIISPEDDASDIDKSNVTFKWSGGNDEDGDTVFIKLLYDTSKTNLNKKVTAENASTLVLSEELKSYTEYFWQVVAYSKAYPDTVKSSIYSFKTKAVPPEIKDLSDRNINVDIGERIVLWVNATGTPEPSYKWKKDGTVMSEETNDSLVIDSVLSFNSGGYAVEVYNEGGTEISDRIDLRVIYPVKIAAGGSHSLILKNDSSLWACGSNANGQLGNKTNNNINVPDSIMDDVANIAAGYRHSFILKNDGSLWVCGQNYEGLLGNGNYDDVNDPDSIMNDVAAISAGCWYNLILKNDGSLWACGDNLYGQLGNGTNNSKNVPDSIMNDVANIAAGGGHSLILKNDGSLWACGYNSSGQLGNGTNIDKNAPDSIMNDVANIAAGSSHSLILKNNGSLLACGYNNYGQLGNGTNVDKISPENIMNNVAAIAAGNDHSLILKNDGSLLACGDNYFGQLGNGTNGNENSPKEIMNNTAAIAAGNGHSLILKNDGTLWASGWNNAGQLGDGTTENKNTPVRIIPKSTNP